MKQLIGLTGILFLLMGLALSCSDHREQNRALQGESGHSTSGPDNGRGFKAVSTGPLGKIVVTSSDGKVLLELPYSELMKIHENAADGSILGWSDDGTYVWFDSFMDSAVVLFGRIDTATKTWVTFRKPKNMAANQFQIDFNTGNVVYSDYPIQFDTQTAAETKTSGREFHLYRNNFFNPDIVLLDTNNGEGFEIRKDANGVFSYRKSPSDAFEEIKFE